MFRGMREGLKTIVPKKKKKISHPRISGIHPRQPPPSPHRPDSCARTVSQHPIRFPHPLKPAVLFLSVRLPAASGNDRSFSCSSCRLREKTWCKTRNTFACRSKSGQTRRILCYYYALRYTRSDHHHHHHHHLALHRALIRRPEAASRQVGKRASIFHQSKAHATSAFLWT